MDKINIGIEIKALIDSIKADADRVEKLDEISQSEQEQLFDKINVLYKKTIVFNYLNSFHDKVESIVTNIGEIENIEEILMVAEPDVINNPVQEIVTEKKQTVVEANEILAVEDAHVIVDLKEEAITPVFESPVQEIKIIPKVEKPSLNKIQKPPINDIKSAIGINDKFQFISELFGGNAEEFNSSIQLLNTSETIDNAILNLSHLEQKFNWKQESDAAKRLTELVERRYL